MRDSFAYVRSHYVLLPFSARVIPRRADLTLFAGEVDVVDPHQSLDHFIAHVVWYCTPHQFGHLMHVEG